MQETVTLYELNRRVRSVVERTFGTECWLQAELSEARLAANGHFYVEFVQKDSTGRNLVARARGTMWARTYNLLAPLFERATGERLRAGITVRVQVTVEFHELYGFSLNITDIDPNYTLGDMARRRREILAQLEADGILNDNRQLPLPRLLKRVAVVSSASAAGYGDFCHQLQANEYGLHFDLRLFPAVMQGANVEESVLAALESIAEEADLFDCAVIIRGGGATSDLSDFDTYTLAAAVAQMPLPVIVGIGHERDETVLDRVAHTRVKTPTAAAAFLIAHQANELNAVMALQAAINTAASEQIRLQHTRLERFSTLLPRSFALITERQGRRLDLLVARLSAAPRQRLADERRRTELSRNKLFTSVQAYVARQQFRIQLLQQKLTSLDPVQLLRRGYSLTFTADGRLLRSADDLRVGDLLTTRLADGTVHSRITNLDATETALQD